MKFEIKKRIKEIFLPCKENNYQPGILKTNFLFYYLVFVLILKLSFLSVVLCLPGTYFFADLSQNLLFDLTNQEREEVGVGNLEENYLLNKAARLKAEDMLKKDYFAHESPEGTKPWYWFGKVGYNYQRAGENLAIGFVDSEELIQAWYDSIPHRENLLNSSFEEMGIAVLTGDFQGEKATVAVQLFGTPKKEKPYVALAKSEPKENEVTAEKTKEVPGPIKISSKEVFMKFVAEDSDNVTGNIIFFSVILVAFLLGLNVFVKMKIQHKPIILKTALCALILITLLLLDKLILLKIFPHQLVIYGL